MDKAKCVILGFFLMVGLLISSSAEVAVSSNISEGDVNQLDDGPEDNEPPVADAGGPYYGSINEEIVLDGSDSYDPDGSIEAYRWAIGKDGRYGSWSENATLTFSCNTPSKWFIKLQVKDDEGATDSDVADVIVPKGIDNKDKLGENKNSDSVISAGPLHSSWDKFYQKTPIRIR